MLDQHPHAAAVLGAALDGRPAHAYLLHGPAGTGKRAAARDFAAALLLARATPSRRATRVMHGTHPDLTWVAPSGAHEMLRRDVQESVVAAASHTPFESTHRVFVLERADTMNDEAANALLKTLEEPPPYVVLLLLTDNPSQVLPTISSRCQPVRFDPLPAAELAQKLQSRGIDPETATACARLSLGDGERALTLALSPELRARTEAFARAPLHGRAHAEQAWRPLLDQARSGAAPRPRRRSRPRSPRSSSTCPRRSTASARPSSPTAPAAPSAAPRPARSSTRSSSSASGTATCLRGRRRRGARPPQRPARRQLREDAAKRDGAAWRAAVATVDDTRAALPLNVSEELALEALAYRLEGR